MIDQIRRIIQGDDRKAAFLAELESEDVAQSMIGPLVDCCITKWRNTYV